MATKTLAQIKAEKAAGKSYAFGSKSQFLLSRTADDAVVQCVATDKFEEYEITNSTGEKQIALRMYTKEGHRVRINDEDVLDKIEVGTKVNCIKQSFVPDNSTSKRPLHFLFLDSIATN